MMSTTADGFWLLDLNGKFIEVNDSLCRLLGYSREELLKLGIADIDGIESPEETIRHMKAVADTGFDCFESRHRRKDGVLIDVESSVSFWRNGGCYLCFSRDIGDRKRAEEQISHLARYDLLTGLANRGVFVEALEQAIARARRAASSFAVLYLDLDHFKDVNDTLGHPVGDLLLQAVADRLRGSIRADDTVARFGGDEFAVLLTDIKEPLNAAIAAGRIQDAVGETIAVRQAAAAAGEVAGKIVHAVGEPFSLQGNEVHIGASVGIAVYGLDSSDAETMLSHADVALYRVKTEARGTYQFFSATMDADVRARVAMGPELREAIAAEQFFLMYQPQIELETGRIVGLEALVRWPHPTRGTVGAGHFIPEAERRGLIVPLGHWVMREACRQAKEWLDAGVAPRSLAINLSGVQFKRPLELEQMLAGAVAEFGIPERLLELELTEGVLMEASQEHNDLLIRFRKSGHHLTIDDFGSGYSSLDYLRRFPVDRIKIAQPFIAEIGQGTGTDAIVKAALGLARELQIEFVVEGAETVAQVELLKSWGCRVIQGFYFSRPLPGPEMTRLLRIGKITPATTRSNLSRQTSP